MGYAKPPKEHQFKAGNKLGKGRQKGAKGLKTIVKEAMGQKVPAKLGGKTFKLSKLELTVHQIATKSSQGDLKAAAKALALYERYGPQDEPDGPEPEKVRRDLEALRGYLAMHDLLNPKPD
ncbi:DUF5681 domain-containing protein [Alteraurantiacibacter buctensis]|uniref:DUF5681 domain-containing protein n=1 Tax=Alteraurantiacibacter buctensis TaxID=1503981 RepID=A0A844Z1C9_9SPHN|nr:hypothetical protein [Alteraurantiacibacter buctensis]